MWSSGEAGTGLHTWSSADGHGDLPTPGTRVGARSQLQVVSWEPSAERFQEEGGSGQPARPGAAEGSGLHVGC